MTSDTLHISPKIRILRKHAAVPTEHGSWVFLFSPLLIGLFGGGIWTLDSLLLGVSLLASFLLRQPVTLVVKVLSLRRPKDDLPAAIFWSGFYGLIGAIAFGWLATRGYGYLVLLAIPAVLTLGWHLWLVSRRSERRQAGVEIIASGTLALAAPAAYWIGVGEINVTGWWLWGLCWLQAASSIVYAYLRLEQRVWKNQPPFREKIRAAARALAYTSFSLIAVWLAGALGFVSQWLFLAFAVQWLESIWGAVNPAIGFKPTRIGVRQLIISTMFTVVFIILW